LEKAGEWQTITLDSGELAGLWIETGQGGAAAQLHEQAQVWPESKEQPLFEHVASTRVVTIQEERDLLPQEDEDYARELSEDWRVIRAGKPPAVIVGSMVHRAIQRWHFPGDKGFEALMQKEALQAGLADAKQRSRALAEAAKLLIRFREHTLWQEINAATERYHELPFTRPGGQDEPIIDTGYIDVLYRNAEGYTLVEFKTDELGNALRRQEMVSQYLPQLSRYVAAVQQLLGIKPRGVLCFLDDRGKVTLEEG
jgi:ATP-dependent exoDNAse (exonuclease V) beta subunit